MNANRPLVRYLSREQRFYLSYEGVGIERKIGTYTWGEDRWSEGEILVRFNVRRGDSEYWRSLKRFLEWLGVGHGTWPRDAYKTLRQRHHETKSKNWDDVLPDEIVRWANTLLAQQMEGEPCCDNTRVARKGNTSQVRRYKSQRAGGCCGFADFEAVGPDGNTYLLGYNYGH